MMETDFYHKTATGDGSKNPPAGRRNRRLRSPGRAFSVPARLHDTPIVVPRRPGAGETRRVQCTDMPSPEGVGTSRRRLLVSPGRANRPRVSRSPKAVTKPCNAR